MNVDKIKHLCLSAAEMPFDLPTLIQHFRIQQKTLFGKNELYNAYLGAFIH